MKPYVERRARLMAQMQAQGGGIAIIPTAPETKRNNDVDHLYRYDSSFHYLSGFHEPDAVIVLIADKNPQSLLFCRPKNPEREVWEGLRYGPAAARGRFGFDNAYSITVLEKKLAELVIDKPAIFYTPGSKPAFDPILQNALNLARSEARNGITVPATFHDVNAIINEMRLIKDGTEAGLMRQASLISSHAHTRAIRACRPGMHEYEIEAELLHEFRKNGADAPAYSPIVASGANTCILHYRSSDAVLQSGELLLVDAGCEYKGYAADISRTYPINGIFSSAQKTLYEIVLAAQQAAIEQIKPGNHFNDPHDAALRVLSQGMLDTGLLDKNKAGSVDDVLEKRDYQAFYMHRTSHWLGMDVHDVGAYYETGKSTAEKSEKISRIFQPGMALTVEPGLYIRPAAAVPPQFWNIGIRIEDDVLVTAACNEVLSAAAPKTVAEIEALMKH